MAVRPARCRAGKSKRSRGGRCESCGGTENTVPINDVDVELAVALRRVEGVQRVGAQRAPHCHHGRLKAWFRRACFRPLDSPVPRRIASLARSQWREKRTPRRRQHVRNTSQQRSGVHQQAAVRSLSAERAASVRDVAPPAATSTHQRGEQLAIGALLAQLLRAGTSRGRASDIMVASRCRSVRRAQSLLQPGGPASCGKEAIARTELEVIARPGWLGAAAWAWRSRRQPPGTVEITAAARRRRGQDHVAVAGLSRNAGMRSAFIPPRDDHRGHAVPVLLAESTDRRRRRSNVRRSRSHFVALASSSCRSSSYRCSGCQRAPCSRAILASEHRV